MKDHADGESRLIPRSRRLVWDLMYFNRHVPLCGHDRSMNLTALDAARKSGDGVRISWPALIAKAYGLVAQDFPALRRTWYRWPIAHTYQHPFSVASVAVHREYKNEPWVFWGLIESPETMSLPDIQEKMTEFQENIPGAVFRPQLKLTSWPTPLRRLIWGWNLAVAKKMRAKRFGTFFLSTLGSRGVEIQVPPSVHTGCLTFGPLSTTGDCRVTLAYDHRIMDGVYVADCLAALESHLSDSILKEVLDLGDENPNITEAA